ncbi:TRAP transporter large permease [Aestuariivirga sp.]|uniref:TRAP transporter large permease n=1 Tax=Aestuariivirga sp. TaxID=2650926 RepID=UPI00359331F3
MDSITILAVLLGVMFLLLGSGVWIGLALMAVGGFAIEVFAGRPAGDAIATTIWSSSSSWMLTALPMFIWMGDILLCTKLSEDLFRGLAPMMGRIPGGLLHTNVMGCTLFGSVSGSSAATLATVGKMTVPELKKRNYPEPLIIGTLAGPATLGLMIPPSIIMIVYGVMTNESIAAINIAGIIPGLVLALLFSGYIAIKSKTMRGYAPVQEASTTIWEKLVASRRLIPVFVLLFLVIGSMFAGYATATESAAVGVAGAFALAWWQGTLSWNSFSTSLMGATMASAMIALILAAASGLSLAMGFLGLPEALAQWVSTLELSSFGLIMCLLVLYMVLGCFLDGISCVALTIAIIEPMVRSAGIDMIWFGIFVVLAVEMAQITPPVGFNLFVLQQMTGHGMFKIARWAFPQFVIMVGMVFVLIAIPELATWLPKQMIPVAG